ncbi:50S ribosomal protein L19 [bacterium]|nr:50S ribosomal protein L19 [bacterium]NBX48878.1 50S ribosomal protein L19 [bacterium]
MAQVKDYAALEPSAITPGQVLRIHEKIVDIGAKGEKRERVQIFEGLVLAVRGAGFSKTFTIRKESNGYGVEKIFPVTTPSIAKIELVKAYRTRRARLTFIKDFARKLKEIVVAKA